MSSFSGSVLYQLILVVIASMIAALFSRFPLYSYLACIKQGDLQWWIFNFDSVEGMRWRFVILATPIYWVATWFFFIAFEKGFNFFGAVWPVAIVSFSCGIFISGMYIFHLLKEVPDKHTIAAIMFVVIGFMCMIIAPILASWNKMPR